MHTFQDYRMKKLVYLFLWCIVLPMRAMEVANVEPALLAPLKYVIIANEQDRRVWADYRHLVPQEAEKKRKLEDESRAVLVTIREEILRIREGRGGDLKANFLLTPRGEVPLHPSHSMAFHVQDNKWERLLSKEASETGAEMYGIANIHERHKLVFIPESLSAIELKTDEEVLAETLLILNPDKIEKELLAQEVVRLKQEVEGLKLIKMFEEAAASRNPECDINNRIIPARRSQLRHRAIKIDDDEVSVKFSDKVKSE